MSLSKDLVWIIWIFCLSIGLIQSTSWEWFGRLANAVHSYEEAYKEGKVRAIGVSNFMQHHLEALETAKIVPHVNQTSWLQVVTKKT